MDFTRQSFKRMLGAIHGYDMQLTARGEDPQALRTLYYGDYLTSGPKSPYKHSSPPNCFLMVSREDFASPSGDDYDMIDTEIFGAITFKDGQFHLKKYIYTRYRDMLQCTEEEFSLHKTTTEPIDLFEVLSKNPVDLEDLCERCGTENVFAAL